MDYDNDGNPDVLSGSWPGELYLFRGKGSGEFEAAEIIKDAEGNEVRAGGKDEASASVVFAHDWDGDSDLDLLIGNIQGNLYLATNTGTATQPAYSPAVALTGGDGSPLSHDGGDSGPVVAEWNGDGKHDLLVGGGDGSVIWFENRKPRTDLPHVARALHLPS